MLRSSIGQLRIVGFAEAVSFLILLGVAVPLKYLGGLPGPVRVVGMIHGVLFLLYIVAVIRAAWVHRWPVLRWFLSLAASFFPFGPFLLDRRLRRDEVESS